MLDGIDYRQLFDDLPMPYMILDTELRFVSANRAYLKATNSKLEDLIGQYIFDAFPDTPERIELFRPAFERAARGETNRVERECYILADEDAEGGKREVWWTTHQFPLYDTEGNIIGMVQKAEDVTVHVEAERTRDVVLREFDHRMNNMLAKVSAIARRTGERYRDIDSFMTRYEARIEAMAKTQKLLMRTQWHDIDLTELAEQEFAPYRDAGDARISVSGPTVLVEGKVAQSLGMVFHELATNAAKYGGLSVPEGKVSLSWEEDSQSRELVIQWIENGLPENTEPPEGDGFGSVIIDKFLPIETGGTAERRFEPGRMTCTITLPAPAG